MIGFQGSHYIHLSEQEVLTDLNVKNELRKSSSRAKVTQVEIMANVPTGRSNREQHEMKRGNKLAHVIHVIERYYRLGDESLSSGRYLKSFQQEMSWNNILFFCISNLVLMPILFISEMAIINHVMYIKGFIQHLA